MKKKDVIKVLEEYQYRSIDYKNNLFVSEYGTYCYNLITNSFIELSEISSEGDIILVDRVLSLSHLEEVLNLFSDNY